MSGDGHHHRSQLKQSNKPFKGKSKGKSERRLRGKVEGRGPSQGPRHTGGGSRAALKASAATGGAKRVRVNAARQQQKLQREAIIAAKRLGSNTGPPKIVAVVALGPRVDTAALVAALRAGAHSARDAGDACSALELRLGAKAHHFHVYACARTRDAVMDACKVADVLLCVVTPDASGGDLAVDADADEFVQLVKAQGLPSLIGCWQGVAAAPASRQAALRKLATRYFHTAFADAPRTLALDSADDAAAVLRFAATCRVRVLPWRDQRAYLMAERAVYTPGRTAVATPPGEEPLAPDEADADDEELGTVAITGWLRGGAGRRLDPSALVHLTGFGDFAVSRICTFGAASAEARKAAARLARQQRKAGEMVDAPGVDDGDADGELQLLCEADAACQHSLRVLAPLDALAHEQSLIADEEFALLKRGADPSAAHSTSGGGGASAVNRAPPGVSAYQQLWDELGAVDDERVAAAAAGQAPAGASAAAAGRAAGKTVRFADAVGGDGPAAGAVSDDDDDGAGLGGMDEDDEDEDATLASLRRSKSAAARGAGAPLTAKQLAQAEQDEIEFPDEVELDRSAAARHRYARYRGLKSLKYSPWSAYENLPLDYSRIAQFADFDSTRRALTRVQTPRALEAAKQRSRANSMSLDEDAASLAASSLGDGDGDDDDGVGAAVGQRVVVYVVNVRRSLAERMCALANGGAASPSPLLLWSLYEHERKVSVLHFAVRRQGSYDAPVRAKAPLVFHCGFRRFRARPIFSYESKESDKAKTARFLFHSQFMVASVYAQVCLPPANVVLTRPADVDGGALVAAGSLLAVNPARMLVKRVVLTGYPIQVHKRHAVIRFMFFNAADVRWFKPVELWTKYGLVGHIREPRGLKGYMKCAFDGHIKQHDTVCLSLYKRQYPKWDEAAFRALQSGRPAPLLAHDEADAAAEARVAAVRAGRDDSAMEM